MWTQFKFIKRFYIFLALVILSINYPLQIRSLILCLGVLVYILTLSYSIPEKKDNNIRSTLYLGIVSVLGFIIYEILPSHGVNKYFKGVGFVLYVIGFYFLAYKIILFHHTNKSTIVKLLMVFISIIPIVGIWFLPKLPFINRKK